MILKVHITGLTIEERDDLLRQLEIIKHHVYPELRVSYSLLKSHPNNISIDQNIEDSEKALFLLQCIQQLHLTHKPDEYYNIDEDVKLIASLEHHRIWE